MLYVLLCYNICWNAPYFSVLPAPSMMSVLWYTAHLDFKCLKSLFVVLSLQNKTCDSSTRQITSVVAPCPLYFLKQTYFLLYIKKAEEESRWWRGRGEEGKVSRFMQNGAGVRLWYQQHLNILNIWEVESELCLVNFYIPEVWSLSEVTPIGPSFSPWALGSWDVFPYIAQGWHCRNLLPGNCDCEWDFNVTYRL